MFDEATGTWKALNFSMGDPFQFQYEFEAAGTGTGATFTAAAHGDLDCDQLVSTFEIQAQVTPSMEIQRAPGNLREGSSRANSEGIRRRFVKTPAACCRGSFFRQFV